MQAKYDLQEVFRIIDLANEEMIWFSVPRKSIYSVVEVFQNTKEPKSNTEAAQFILNVIRKLEPKDFVNQVSMYNDPKDIADEYGVIYDNKPWYIKFQIQDQCLNEISFHPPSKPLVTFKGIVIYG